MSTIKPSEVSKILLEQLKGIHTDVELEEVGTVLQVGDGIARIHGLTHVKANRITSYNVCYTKLLRDTPYCRCGGSQTN